MTDDLLEELAPEIPDGYVEPAVDTYVALAEYARRGQGLFRALDPKDKTRGGAYFARLVAGSQHRTQKLLKLAP